MSTKVTSVDAVASADGMTQRKRLRDLSYSDLSAKLKSTEKDSSTDQDQPHFSHIYPIHSVSKGSILSRESTTPTPSFVGFKNLAMIVLGMYYYMRGDKFALANR